MWNFHISFKYNIFHVIFICVWLNAAYIIPNFIAPLFNLTMLLV